MSSAFEGVGDEASRVVIPIIAVSMLGAGALEVGVINALGLSAFLTLGVPIGVWVDRLRRRWLMIAADVFRALVVLSVPAAFVTGAMTIGHLLVCVALISVADVVFTTAHGAFVASVVDREQVSDAHARLQSAASMVAVGSPSLTAALLSVIAAPFALVTAGISYVLSALTLASLQVGEDVKPLRQHEGFWPAARAGLSFTIHQPVLRGLFLSGMVLNAATMFGSAATAVYALGVLGLSPAVFALLGSFAALGALGGLLRCAGRSEAAGHREDQDLGRRRLRPYCRADAPRGCPALVPGALARRVHIRVGIPRRGHLGGRSRHRAAHRSGPQARNRNGEQPPLCPWSHAARQPHRGRVGRMDRCPTRALDLGPARRRLCCPDCPFANADLAGISGGLRRRRQSLSRLTPAGVTITGPSGVRVAP